MCHNNRRRERAAKTFVAMDPIQQQMSRIELFFLRARVESLLTLEINFQAQRLTMVNESQENLRIFLAGELNSSERADAEDKLERNIRMIPDCLYESQVADKFRQKVQDLTTPRNLPEVVEVPNWILFDHLVKIYKLTAPLQPLVIHIYKKDDDACSQLATQLSSLAAIESNKNLQFLKIRSTRGKPPDTETIDPDTFTGSEFTDVPALMAFKDGACFTTLLKPYSEIQQFYDTVGIHHHE